MPRSTVGGERGVGCGRGTQRGVRRRGSKLGPAQRPVNPFAGERVEEPGRIADEQVPRAGSDRHPAAQGAGPQQRLCALRARQATPQSGELRQFVPEQGLDVFAPLPHLPAGQHQRDVHPATGQRRQPHVSAGPHVHLAVARQRTQAVNVLAMCHQAGPVRPPARPDGVGLPRHRGVQPVGANDQPRRDVPRRATPRRRADAADPLPFPQQVVNARALPDGRPTPLRDSEQSLIELWSWECQRLPAGIRAGKALAGRSDELHPA